MYGALGSSVRWLTETWSNSIRSGSSGTRQETETLLGKPLGKISLILRSTHTRDPTGWEQEAGCPAAAVNRLYSSGDSCLRRRHILRTEPRRSPSLRVSSQSCQINTRAALLNLGLQFCKDTYFLIFKATVIWFCFLPVQRRGKGATASRVLPAPGTTLWPEGTVSLSLTAEGCTNTWWQQFSFFFVWYVWERPPITSKGFLLKSSTKSVGDWN